MNRSEGEKLILKMRSAGYNDKQIAERFTLAKQGLPVPEDPTERLWPALIQVESGGDQSAVSPVGALGRAQVMPSTGPEAARYAGRQYDEERLRGDAEYNEALGRAYLRKLHEQFGDDRLALAAYNGGPGRLERVGRDINKMPAETRAYVPKIMGKVKGGKMNKREMSAFIMKRLDEGATEEEIAAEVSGMRGNARQISREQPAPQAPMPDVPRGTSEADRLQQILSASPSPAAPQTREDADAARLRAILGIEDQPAAPVAAPAPPPPAAAGQQPPEPGGLLSGIRDKGRDLTAQIMAAQGASPEEVQAEQQALQAADQDASGTWFGRLVNEMSRQGFSQGGLPGRVKAGLNDIVANAAAGGGQLASSLLGDEEMRAKFSEDAANRAAMYDKYDPTDSGFSGADLGRTVGEVLSYGSLPGKALAQGAWGALQAGLKPVQNEEDRVWNAVAGGLLGTMGTKAGEVFGKGIDRIRSMKITDAADKFSKERLGYSRLAGDETLPLYKGVVDKVNKGVSEATDFYKKAITSAERTPLPKVTLGRTFAKSGDAGSISDQLLKKLSPKMKAAIGIVNDASGTVSRSRPLSPMPTRATRPVRTAGGWQEQKVVPPKSFSTVKPTEVSFKEARDVLRRIKSIERKMPADEALPLNRLRESLEKDLDVWGRKYKPAGVALQKARDADAYFKDTILPYKAQASKLEATNKQSFEESVRKLLYGNATTSGNAGSEIEKVLKINPEAKSELRGLLGADFTFPRGPTASARAISGGTTAEVLLDPQERKYLIEAAKRLEPIEAMDVGKQWQRTLLNLMRGSRILPYGKKPVGETLLRPELLRALRAGTIGSEGDY